MATNILCADKYPTLQKEIPVVIKLAGGVEINENDPHQITHLKGRMASEIESRTQDKELVVVTCVLNPFTKSLDVQSANECLDGHQMLLKAALNMKPKPVLKVKKEPWISKSQNDSLPTLPVVIPQGTTRKSEQVLSDSESKPKKARTS